MSLAASDGEPFLPIEPRTPGNIRTLSFGPDREGLLLYLIVDHAQEVGVIELLWIG